MTGLEMIEYLHFSRMTILSSWPRETCPRMILPASLVKPEATLQKPFTNDDLLDAISSVLGTGGSEDHKATQPPNFF